MNTLQALHSSGRHCIIDIRQEMFGDLYKRRDEEEDEAVLEISNNDTSNLKRKRDSFNKSLSRFKVMYTLCGIINELNTIPRIRGPNQARDRQYSLEYVRSWDDVTFQRQFRLHRRAFNNLINLLIDILETNESMAIRSSGSSINPELKLYITLRILAGASYLDMIWYNVSVNSVMMSFLIF